MNHKLNQILSFLLHFYSFKDGQNRDVLTHPQININQRKKLNIGDISCEGFCCDIATDKTVKLSGADGLAFFLADGDPGH